MKLTIKSPEVLRALRGCEDIVSEENRIGKAHGHRFKPGDIATLAGLVSFPEYNGETVTVTNIREDADGKRAYYALGRINQHMNWVFEKRLKPAA